MGLDLGRTDLDLVLPLSVRHPSSSCLSSSIGEEEGA